MTPGPAARQRVDYGPEAFARIRDSLYGRAEQAGQREEPRVRIIAPPTLGIDRYVDATVRVSQDAYVLVVAADLDGRIRVIYPESPDESGFVSASAPHKLSKFFAGFGALGSSRFGRSAFSVQPVSRYAQRGALVAIASERPLQLAKITDANGDWDEAALERLVYGRSPQSAGYALGSELSLAGQGFDTDFSGLTLWGTPSLYSLASVGSALCESELTGALYYDGPRPTTFFVQDGTRYAVITTGDACGGYQTHTVPAGPAPMPIPRDSADSARIGAGVTRIAGRSTNGGGRFGSEQVDGTVARARRSGPRDPEGNALRPTDRPNVVGGLRFRPPEQLRTEPRLREAPGFRTLPDDQRARIREQATEGRAQRPTPQYEERARPVPEHRDPAPVREAPMAPPPAPAATPSEPRAGRPVRE
ncbi:MAG TPA: hypothetical protein VGP25_12415 [Gemmatimonadaceae bacterium]|nr:hypothetical protein [Gemmatimonadaceae bacterium]